MPQQKQVATLNKGFSQRQPYYWITIDTICDIARIVLQSKFLKEN